MKSFYIAHNFHTRKSVRKWQLKIESKYNINLDNPFYGNPKRTGLMQMIDGFKEGSKDQKEFLSNYYKESNKQIVNDDLTMIRKSDGLVAVVNDTRIGTPMEIFYAGSILRIPVYIITHKHQEHPWIQKFATKIFTSRQAFEDFIKREFGLRNGL